jgi:hypothetical protein
VQPIQKQTTIWKYVDIVSSDEISNNDFWRRMVDLPFRRTFLEWLLVQVVFDWATENNRRTKNERETDEDE